MLAIACSKLKASWLLIKSESDGSVIACNFARKQCQMQLSMKVSHHARFAQVKEVPNGDTLVICGNVASGPPPEKRITLASLVAPRLVSRFCTAKRCRNSCLDLQNCAKTLCFRKIQHHLSPGLRRRAGGTAAPATRRSRGRPASSCAQRRSDRCDAARIPATCTAIAHMCIHAPECTASFCMYQVLTRVVVFICSNAPSRWTTRCPRRRAWSSAPCLLARRARMWPPLSSRPAGRGCAESCQIAGVCFFQRSRTNRLKPDSVHCAASSSDGNVRRSLNK